MSKELEDNIEKIRSFWNEQAEKHQEDLQATTPDPLAKRLEIEALARALDPAKDVLEVGCGNGHNLFGLAETFKARLHGIDYAATMVAMAQRINDKRSDRERFSFAVGDIRERLPIAAPYSQVFTNRCLINLPNLDLQIGAVENLADAVVTGGRLALVESTRQGQERLNDLRGRVGLNPIPFHWHNLYLDEPEFLRRIPKNLRLVQVDAFASLYFMISRVFNAKLTPEGQAPDYLAEINQIAAKLPSVGDCAPLKLFLFEKL